MNLILHCQLNLDLHCFIISDLSHVCVDSSGFRMSGGWTTAKRGTVPVPRRFDSKQLTVAPQLLSKLPSANMPACQACVQAQVTLTLVSVSQSAASQGLSTCHLKLHRERGETSAAAAVWRSCCGQQGSFGRQCVRGRTIHKQPGQHFAKLSDLTTTHLNFGRGEKPS